MRAVHVLIIVAVGFLAYNQWAGDPDFGELVAEAGTDNGFIPALMLDGARPDTVYIMTPKNCPSEAAQRAERLAERLDERGIPTVRRDHFRAEVNNPTDEEMQLLNHTTAILDGEIPAVFVNDMGSVNPSVQEVVGELERTSGRSS